MHKIGFFSLIILTLSHPACRGDRKVDGLPKPPKKAAIDHAKSPEDDSKTVTDKPRQTEWKTTIESFVKKQDLLPTRPLVSLTQDDVKQRLYNRYVEPYATSTTYFDRCIEDLLADKNWKVTGKVASLAAEIDIISCINQTDARYSKYSAQLNIVFECENGDVSQIDGKSNEEVIEIAAASGQQKNRGFLKYFFNLCKDGHVAWLRQIVYDAHYEEPSESGVAEVEKQYRSVSSTADGLPCIEEINGDTQKILYQCQDFNIDSTLHFALDGEIQPFELMDDFSIFKYKGVETKGKSDNWYSAGSIKVTINEWKGSIDYNSSNLPPRYSLSNYGADLSGTISSITSR